MGLFFVCRLNGAEGHCAAVPAAHVRRAVDASGKGVLDKRCAVGLRPDAGETKAAVFFGGVEDRRGEILAAYRAHSVFNALPVDIVCLRPQRDIAYLTQSDAGVNKVLVRMQQQEAHVVGIVEREQPGSLYVPNLRPGEESGVIAVERVQRAAVAGKQLPVPFNEQAVSRVARLVGVFVVRRSGLKAELQHFFVKGGVLPERDVKIFVRRGAQVGLWIQCSADDAFDDNGADPRVGQRGVYRT